MSIVRVLTLAVLASIGGASVSAETVLTPFAGVAFGGATERSRGTYGGALGFLGRTSGFEVEFGTTPHFFGDAAESEFFTKNDVVTLMGSLLLVLPGDDVRVYGALGAGLMKTRLEEAADLFDIGSTDFGFAAGGGVMVFVGRTVGLRADIRYLRSFSDLDGDGGPSLNLGPVEYWRAVGGISLRF